MSPLPPGPPEQLSGVAVVIIIAVRTAVVFFISSKWRQALRSKNVFDSRAFLLQVGVQTIIMLFIFAKRQVMRFALRSRRGPHVSVGQVLYIHVAYRTKQNGARPNFTFTCKSESEIQDKSTHVKSSSFSSTDISTSHKVHQGF